MLERLTIINPSFRVNDFTGVYSPFDGGLIGRQKILTNPVFDDELHHRFAEGKNPISLALGDDTNHVVLEPIFGYAVFADKDGERFNIRTSGLKLFGNLGDHVVFYASAMDNLQRGMVLDRKKELEPTNGFVISSDRGSQGFDFDEAQVRLGFRWGGTQVFLEKLRNRWGYGESGNIVLSEKAPSYPQLRIVVHVTENLKFTYLLASLYSDVVDSLESYQDITSGYYRTVFRTKYMAAHVLEYAPSPRINIALGESMIFSDQFQPVYLLPLMIFKSAEHQKRIDDNAQIFGGLRYSFPPYGMLYGTLFIDDLNTDKIFSAQNTNIIAGTIGGKFVDVLWNNFDCSLEYTRLNPWVYTHKWAATTYTSNSYVLGHWLGQNADILYASAQYRWIRPLWLTLYAQKLRKGVLGAADVHYSQPWAQKLLAGPLFRQTQAGLKGRWEIYRYLFFNCDAALWSQTDDVQNRYPSFLNKFFANLSITYNLFSGG